MTMSDMPGRGDVLFGAEAFRAARGVPRRPRTYPALVGKTIAEIRIESVESETEDRERLTILFTDGHGLVLETQDFEGYRSWLVERGGNEDE